jgi:hypothetical protein
MGAAGWRAQPCVAQATGPHVQPLQFDEIESEKLHLVVVAAGMQPVEVAHAVAPQDHAFAVDHERCRGQLARGLDDEGKRSVQS